MAPPRLTFFCELESDHLLKLINEEVIDLLSSLNASLSLGILDLSEERADIVRRLNQAGVSVIAWLLLPRDQGYWFNIDNASQAVSCYEDFKIWSDRYGLQWTGVGLDIEPDIRDLAQFTARNWRLVARTIYNLFDKARLNQAKTIYSQLIERIRADGYLVDSYHFPVISDERAAGSTLIQRATGLVDVRSDREVWMLYTSFMRPHGAGLLASYAPQAQSLGLGSTGGGVDVGFLDTRPLTWDEFARDLRLAWYWCDDLQIFSLEGCIEQGFLKRLTSFAWDYPFLIPERSLARVNTLRGLLRAVLWAGSNLGAITLAAGLILITWKGIRRFLGSRRNRLQTRYG